MQRVRQAGQGDVDALLPLYEAARRRMAEQGNPTQWRDGYPSRSLLLEDCAQGSLYVVEEEGRLQGGFVFRIGADPMYRVIRAGCWRSDAPYGTIHRLVSDGRGSGVFSACLAFCSRQTPHLRIDTHADNAVMRRLIPRAGFQYCGIVTAPDGSPRLAYDRLPAPAPEGREQAAAPAAEAG